jgi:hypothetical protein
MEVTIVPQSHYNDLSFRGRSINAFCSQAEVTYINGMKGLNLVLEGGVDIDLLDNYESYSLDALMAEREAWEKSYEVLLAQQEALEQALLLVRRHLRTIDRLFCLSQSAQTPVLPPRARCDRPHRRGRCRT